MLCDLIQGPVPKDMPEPLANVWRAMAKDIEAAGRYSLADDVIAAAFALSLEKPSTLKKVLDLARPPHRQTWIEWPEVPRNALWPQFGVIAVEKGLEQPDRMGFLITQEGEDSTRYRFEPLWSFRGKDVEIPTVGLVFDLANQLEITAAHKESIANDIKSMSRDPGALVYQHGKSPAQQQAYLELATHGTFVLTRGAVAYRQIGTMIPSLSARIPQMFQAHQDDIAGESLFILAVLLLMATSNATRVTQEDRTRLRAARLKQKKPPVLDHGIVSMRLSKPERDAMFTAPDRGRGGQKARHVCRGHFKRLGTGEGTRLVWWREHWRGDASTGVFRRRTREVRL